MSDDSFISKVFQASEIEAALTENAKKRQSELEKETWLAKRQKILNKLQNKKLELSEKNYLENELEFYDGRLNQESDSTDLSKRDVLLRNGQITPFSNITGLEQQVLSDNDPYLPDEAADISTGDSIQLSDEVYAEYMTRWLAWAKQRLSLRKSQGHVKSEQPDDPLQEPYLPHPKYKGITFTGGLHIPGDIAKRLYTYQRTGVKWLWELYAQRVGGIIGDEMGLGKTVQIIGFLASLHHSKMLKKNVLIICPATVMKQWTNEFHQWWPPFRVIILHASSNFKEEEDLDNSNFLKQTKLPAGFRAALKSVESTGHIVITTYAGLRIYSRALLPIEWEYAVLDEGHKIRNPDSEIALTCKQIRTNNRIILSGTPIQNNLNELWSLFDFVYPGRLGTLPIFQAQFSIPIRIGGYANANSVQIQTAYRCACVLRELIGPYLLRRMKSEVAKSLPHKEELVLFCKLTKDQQKSYKDFLKSDELSQILSGKRHVLYGIDILRKICNHPDLVYKDILLEETDKWYGDPKKSGKFQVLKSLIEKWTKTGHRCLVFCQTRQMLDIIEKGVQKYKYLRMDGTTPIGTRQTLIDKFNESKDIELFLLTTRVGGLGVNLVGADRVIIFDPDWNPSTDLQARERAWRLGQKREVIIVRLMTNGTIEEKIYHRQIYKQLLSNKILSDPHQSRFFKFSDLHDLFTLNDETNFENTRTATGEIFMGSEMVANDKDIASVETYENQSNDDSKQPSILDSIFAETGVKSAVFHDKIISQGSSDWQKVDLEAKVYAKHAFKIINTSHKIIKTGRKDDWQPTWTGKSGLNIERESSKSIIDRLKQH